MTSPTTVTEGAPSPGGATPGAAAGPGPREGAGAAPGRGPIQGGGPSQGGGPIRGGGPTQFGTAALGSVTQAAGTMPWNAPWATSGESEPEAAPHEPAAVPERSGRPEWRVPRVNLLPQEIQDARALRGLQRKLAAAVLGVLLVVVLGTVLAGYQVGSARGDLEETQAYTHRLKNQQAQLAEVPRALNQLDTVRKLREQAMARDVLWATLINELTVSAPPQTRFDQVTFTLAGETSTSAGGASAAGGTAAGAAGTAATAGSGARSAGSGVGSVTVQGRIASYAELSAWLVSAGSLPGLGDPTLETASKSTGESDVGFTVSLTVTAAALSHRYDRKAS